jgi:uncharacterized protein (TIRG00374 family)
LKRLLQVAAIVALTVFFLWLFLKNANLGDVWHILRAASPWWLALAVALNVMALFFRTFRWRAILVGRDHPRFYPAFFANAIGYMVSTLLPIRAADVVRPALLARKSDVRFSAALGTVMTERILDLISILTLFLWFVALRWREYSGRAATAELWSFVVKPAALGAGVILLLVIAFILGLSFFRSHVRRFHQWVGGIVPKRFRGAWMNFFDAFVQTLALARQPVAGGIVLLSTLGLWACLTLQFTYTVKALHLHLPFDSAFFVTGATTVGLAVPTPGGIGGMHKICQFVLTRFYDMGIDESVAAAVLFHLVGSVPVVIIGTALFIGEGLRWRDVTRA